MARFISETWDDALVRRPGLSKFIGVPMTGPQIAEVFELVDTYPGYALFQVLIHPVKQCDFIFREIPR